VENLTDRIILINNGRMLASGDRHEIRKLMDHIPRQVKVSPIDKANLRILAKRMLDEEWVRAARVDEDQGEILLETDRAETFYLELPKILQKEKIAVTKINSDDDSLDSLYEKIVGGSQWK
jgi:ABC-type multidrug transport system ATPase subunit